MITNDYLMRMIEQFGHMMRSVLGARAKGDEKTALALIRDSYGDIFGLDATVLSILDAASIADMLNDPGQLLPLARVMCREAEQLYRMSDPFAREAARRALLTLAEARRHNEIDDNVREDVRSMLIILPVDELSPVERDIIALARIYPD